MTGTALRLAALCQHCGGYYYGTCHCDVDRLRARVAELEAREAAWRPAVAAACEWEAATEEDEAVGKMYALYALCRALPPEHRP